MSRKEDLIREVHSLKEWIEKIKENNPNELEAWHLIETLEDKIKELEKELKKYENEN